MCLIITSFLLVSCGSGPGMVDDSATRAPADIFSNYQPPAEDEVSEFIGIADLTVEEIKALLGEPEPESVPGDEGKFSDRFPSLKVSHDKLNVEISSESISTQVLNIDREANGDFEWNFMLAEQPEWLSAHRPLDPEEGDIDSLGLAFDATGLPVGDYMITLKVFGLTLVRDSPQEIPIMLTVRL